MDDVRFSLSCALDVVGWRRGEPPLSRYDGTADRGLGCKGIGAEDEELVSGKGILGGD